jgi:hypothetical protein
MKGPSMGRPSKLQDNAIAKPKGGINATAPFDNDGGDAAGLYRLGLRRHG